MIIKIGAQEYTIEERSKTTDATLNEGNYAYTLETGNLIVIDRDISKGKKQVTVLHEILHAIRYINDAMPKPKRKDDFEDWEHYFIALYENNFLMVMKDNPELVKWLTD